MLFRKTMKKPILQQADPDPLQEMKIALESLDKVIRDAKESRAKVRRILDVTDKIAMEE